MLRVMRPGQGAILSVLFAAGLTSTSGPAQAVPNRAALNVILGSASVHEDFESYVSVHPFAVNLGVASLDHRTVANGHGPGLVEPGATYSAWNGTLVSYSAGVGMLTSQGLAPSISNGMIVQIDYELPVPAMGLDLVAWSSLGASGLVRIRDANGGWITAVPFSTTTQTFIGWQHAGGIGSVEVQSSAPSPVVIDDHTYGLDLTQVAVDAPVGVGCYRRFAAFYESTFTFDLSNTSMSFARTGSTYAVTTGTNPVIPPTGPPTSMGNYQVVPFALGWPLPHPGGTTTTLYVASNGFVHFVQNTNPSLFLSTFLNGGPVIAAKSKDLATSQGTVTFETDPVLQTAVITFDQVPYVSNPAILNTFQYSFDASGDFEVRYGSCGTGAGFTGWSPGNGNADPGSIDISATPVITLAPQDRLPLVLTASARPVTGSTPNLILSNVPAGSLLAAHVFGLTAVVPATNLSAVGMPDCFQYFSQDAVSLTLNPAGTSTQIPWPVPNDPSFAGVAVGVQGAVFDPATGHNPLGGLSSNGLELRINQL